MTPGKKDLIEFFRSQGSEGEKNCLGPIFRVQSASKVLTRQRLDKTRQENDKKDQTRKREERQDKTRQDKDKSSGKDYDINQPAHPISLPARERERVRERLRDCETERQDKTRQRRDKTRHDKIRQDMPAK